MNQLQIKVGGIKCDNTECNFNDMTVLFEDYDKWLNRPCPECGCNLLTHEDFDRTKLLIQMANYLAENLPEINEDEQLYKTSASFYGTGEVTFSDIELIKKGGEVG